MSNSKAKSSETTIDSDEYVEAEFATFENDEKTKQDEEYAEDLAYLKAREENGTLDDLSAAFYHRMIADENSK